eukprot:2225584-Amphidinium_carterae.2
MCRRSSTKSLVRANSTSGRISVPCCVSRRSSSGTPRSVAGVPTLGLSPGGASAPDWRAAAIAAANCTGV